MSKKKEFKLLDPEGLATLNVVAEADRFNHWIYQTISPYCNGKTLEIGSGIGNSSKYFLNNNQELSLSDIRQNYIDILGEQFATRSNLNAILKIDIVSSDFDITYAHYFKQFDCIYALNVIEHVENDSMAIANCKKLLKTGGKLIILVPAYQQLYNNFDKELEHYRRYSLKQLDLLMVENELTIIHHQHFNFVGILGWWLNGSLLKKKIIPSGQMKLYNSLVPVFKIVDKCIFNTMGLNVISVGQKK